MNNHKTFAIILNDEIVNIIVAESIIIAGMCAKEIDVEKAYSVECTDYPCSIGDYYIDNTFYFKDKITPIPNNSIENILSDLQREKTDLKNDLENLIKSYKELYDNFVNLTKCKNDIESALCELSILTSDLINKKEE